MQGVGQNTGVNTSVQAQNREEASQAKFDDLADSIIQEMALFC